MLLTNNQQFHAGTSQFSQAECCTSAHAKKLSTLYSQYVQWREIIEREETLEVFFDLLFAEMDENLVQELSEELLSFQKAVNIILYSSQGFTPGALVRLQIQSRAGGQEARDWTRMLGRMYRQFLKSQQIAYRDTSFGSSIEFQFEYCEKLQT